jgi:L-threonylcarbamoyladenylate synthase
MKTKLTTSPAQAAQFIARGEIVAFPTETVYGLGANAFDPDAIKKIFEAKGRPSDNPLIVHIAHHSELAILTERIPDIAEAFIEQFFPGALTLVLPKSKFVPSIVTAGLKTVAIRMPAHLVGHKFLRECGVSIAAPSANLSGKPSATTWQAVKDDLDGKISCILKDDESPIGLESTVVDCTGRVPIVLRTGAITLEQLQAVNPDTRLSKSTPDAAPKSPGMKYKHYAPDADVVLIDSVDELSADEITNPPATLAFIGLHTPSPSIKFVSTKICASVEDYAQSLFTFFRDCDRAGIERIYCERVPGTGLGLALMDRLGKAAK